jgi:hypothetical protein
MPAVAKSISCNGVERRHKSVTPLNGVPRDAMIHSMPDLLAALRARRDELELTHERLDDISGLPSGYCGKLLAPVAIKNLGWLSFGLVLDSMGCALVLVEDAEKVRLVKNRWVKRERPIRNAAPARKEPQQPQQPRRHPSSWRP